MLEMKHVTFQYVKHGSVILDDITLSFDKGEFIAITGRNGSGKTTVTRVLVGLEKPVSGQVIYNGQDVTSEDASERSRFIGYVFQQPDRQMFMPTVREEVGFGPYQQGKRGKELDDIVNAAMENTNIADLADAYPRTLSRGDQQRVAIASALAMNTEIVILDEPTSGQDGNEKKRLVQLMNHLVARGITIILVTHDMDIVASDCSRVIVIANHKAVFDGKPEDLFTEEGKAEQFGLAAPPSVVLGRQLPGSPYCRNMDVFCESFLKAKEGENR
jgi:energy-coupling factor transport system ATP-binding protein